MKLFNKTILFLVLAIAFVLSGLLMDRNSIKISTVLVDTNSFHKVLHKKELQLDEILQSLSDQLQTSGLSEMILKNGNDFDELLNKKGFAFLIYENNELSYWSDNAFPVSFDYTKSKLTNDIVHLQNAWYKTEKRETGNFIIIGLILIKQQYSYENKFLENGFQSEFKTEPDVTISIVPYSEGYPIHNSNGEYIFSLVPQVRKNTVSSYLSAVLSVLSICFVLLFLFYATEYVYSIKNSNWWLLALLADIVLIRALMVIFKFPSNLYEVDLFGPSDFAYSAWLPSLGDFMLDAFFVLFFLLIVAKKLFLPKICERSSIGIKLFAVISGLISVLLFYAAFLLILALVMNSSFSMEVNKITEMNFYSMIAYCIIASLLGAWIISLDKLIVLCRKYLKFKEYILFFIVPSLICLIALVILSGFVFNTIPIIFVGLILSLISYLRFFREHFRYPALVLTVFLISLFTTWFAIDSSAIKEKGVRKILALTLANERDPIAELLFRDIEKEMTSDESLRSLMSKDFSDETELFNFVEKKYFSGFWNKYDIVYLFCSSSMEFPPENHLESCDNYFDNLLAREGIMLSGSNFYYVDNKNRRISYFGSIENTSVVDSSKVKLYIELDSKLITEELGYPELLLDKKLIKKSNLSGYSYAKYSKGHLISQSGSFRYNLTDLMYRVNDKEFTFVEHDGFDHLSFKVDKENTILISKPGLETLDLLISFSYIFIFFYLLLTVSMLIKRRSILPDKIQLNFKIRVQTAMISVLLLSLLMIGFSTVYYNIKQYKSKQNQNVSEKMQSVLVELTHKLEHEPELNSEMSEYLTGLLVKFSNVFYSDINLYDLDGFLLASSRPEIFSKGLIGNRMDSKAFRELGINKNAKLIHNENIGSLDYLSVYVPFKNSENKLLAYLNLPYFTKQTELTQEITALVVTIINIYILLLLLTVFVAVVITNRLTQPLRLIQQNFRAVELGKKNEPINYKGSDEIGSLVGEYNRMIEELANSATLLAKSERESAWREMAKQIAHEIKNPLTPMKLSVQHLMRSWHDKAPNWEERLEKVTATIIEQIDTLSAIAAEFSSFAKMPKPSLEIVNICDKIRNSINLFEDTENIDFLIDFGGHDEVYIYADKEQILRVFNNLIKNSIQAISHDRTGWVKISLKVKPDNVVIIVTDNGMGIQEEMKHKLFMPNFTTKTSGMGLGLAMVKNIVESANGSIWFDTKIGRGTSFYLEFATVDKTDIT